MKRLLIILAVLALGSFSLSGGEYVPNRAPLSESRFMELPLGAIKPEGWLKLQLQTQVTGLTGHLDEAYPNVVGKRNAWLGGDGDAWERGPYWIDGLLPLAYILDDQELKDKAQVWVEAILGSQKEDGYFGPDIDRDPEPGGDAGAEKRHDQCCKQDLHQFFIRVQNQRKRLLKRIHINEMTGCRLEAAAER